MERACRLKMLMGQGKEVVYEVPGGRITRGETSFVPGGRWAKVMFPDGSGYGLVSDTFYGFENEAGNFAAVICRGTRYCTDITGNAAEFPERPTADNGELKFNFAIASVENDLERLSENFEQPPVTIMCTSHHGDLPPSGALLEISRPGIKLCDLQYHNGILTAWLQNQTDAPQSFSLKTAKREQPITALPSWQISKIAIPLK